MQVYTQLHGGDFDARVLASPKIYGHPKGVISF
jgi:hypothetical protein